MTAQTPIRPAPQLKRRYSLWRLIRANFYDLRLLLRESWVMLAGFGLLALMGTLYLRTTKSMRFPSALYETLKLLTLQSGLELPSDRVGQLLFFLIPLLGLALIFQSVLNFGRLLLDKSSRREAWQVALASTYRDHVIVCGLGRVTLRVVLQLLETGHDVVVIERDWHSEFVERALHLRVPVVLGDAREVVILRQAGLMRARAVCTGINDDLLNIEIALTVRKTRPDIRVVLRVFNEELDRNLERTFGKNSAFSASALAAPTFAAALISSEVDYVLPTGNELLGISRLGIQPDSHLSGFIRTLEETRGIRVLDHRDSTGHLLQRARLRQLSGGDQVTLLGSLSTLQHLREANRPGSKLSFLSASTPQRPNDQLDTIIVCGLGKVGYRVVQQLHNITPRPRVVVVRLHDGRTEFTQHISQLKNVHTVLGDARNIDVLREAGIDRAFAIAGLTADDLLNLQIGLAARRDKPDIHVVLRVFSDTLADKLADMFGIRTIYSTSGLAGPTLAAAAVLGDICHAFFAGGQLFSSDHLVVQPNDGLAQQSVESIRSKYNALVIELCRAGKSKPLPELDTVICPNDMITLLAPLESLSAIRTTAENKKP